MKKLGILLLVLCIKSAFSVPTVDVAKAIERTTSIAKKAESFNELKTKYIDKYTVQIQSSSNIADAFNNGFANEVIRNNQARIDSANQHLKLSSEPMDICEVYSLSTALNDFVCDSLSTLGNSSSQFIQISQNHEKVAKDADSHKINDINTISVTTLPAVNKNDDVETQSDRLQEQAYKSTVNTLTTSIKLDQENLYNTLSNQANNDFGTDEIKKIQESYSQSQLYRKMAIMLAQNNYADMLAYKHQLQNELSMAMELLQQVNNQNKTLKK